MMADATLGISIRFIKSWDIARVTNVREDAISQVAYQLAMSDAREEVPFIAKVADALTFLRSRETDA